MQPTLPPPNPPCPFTGVIPIEYLTLAPHLPEQPTELKKYGIIVNSLWFSYLIDEANFNRWRNDPWFVRNGYLFGAAMQKGVNLFLEDELITLELIKQRVNSSTIPHTPRMKLDGLLKYINDNTLSQGQGVMLHVSRANINEPAYAGALRGLLRDTYLKDTNEAYFYLQTLENEKLITIININNSSTRIALTYNGLTYLASLETEGNLSKNCFVAMSFAPARQPYREAIERAIRATGYEPILIDTRHIDSDKTINDRIISEIRACKFCVADFTDQRNGIYFEAGFALGLGKAIIYACDATDFRDNSHFDLKPFQHILYNTIQELEEQLGAKINAWIQ